MKLVFLSSVRSMFLCRIRTLVSPSSKLLLWLFPPRLHLGQGSVEYTRFMAEGGRERETARFRDL